MTLYDNGCSGVLNREHAQRLHVLPSTLLRHLQNAWAKSMRSFEMKSWTVTRVIMWHLCQHGVEASKDWVSVAHFNHLFNTPMPHIVTDVPRSPDVTLLKQAGWYPWAVRLWICVGQLCTQNVTHACLFTNVRTHAQHIQSPRPVENLTSVGQCS